MKDLVEVLGKSKTAPRGMVKPQVAVVEAPPPPPPAQEPYTPEAMVSLILRQPDYTHLQLAHHFGRGLAWFSAVMVSEAFQLALDPHRHLIADPSITSSLDERFRALAFQGLGVLHQKLESKEINDQTVLKAVEIGVKALGIGAAPPALPAPTVETGADAVANRIMAAMAAAKERSNLQAVDVEVKEVPSGR